jgi:hypothetical protein
MNQAMNVKCGRSRGCNFNNKEEIYLLFGFYMQNVTVGLGWYIQSTQGKRNLISQSSWSLLHEY